MEKYKTYKHIDKREVSSFQGLDKEILTYFLPSAKPVPFTIESYGITFPDKKYHIKRKRSSYFILEYVVSGKGTLIKDDWEFALSAGDAYLLEPGSAHEYYSNKNDPFQKYWINFKSEIFFDIVRTYNLTDMTIFKGVDLTEQFKKIFELEKISVYNEDIYEKASAIVFECLMLLAKAHHNSSNTSEYSPLAEEIKSLLDRGLTANITLDEICQKLFISRSKLFREFKKYYNITPYEYLIERKLTLAKQLLINTNYSISEIAERLDFADVHYFSVFFRGRQGCSPSAYRENKRLK